MKKLISAVQQFLFRTLNPTGWRVEQLTKELSPKQLEALAHLKEQVSTYWEVFNGKRGFGHLANTEPLVFATIAMATAIASAVEAQIPLAVIEYHTPERFHGVFVHAGTVSA